MTTNTQTEASRTINQSTNQKMAKIIALGIALCLTAPVTQVNAKTHSTCRVDKCKFFLFSDFSHCKIWAIVKKVKIPVCFFTEKFF
jgi:hypothetical protein